MRTLSSEATTAASGTDRCKIAVIFLHPGCRMSCRFCVTEDSFSSMSFEQALELLEHLEERSIRSIVLGGGEPFDWQHDPLRLAAEARRRGFFVQIGTNGVALPQGYEHDPSVGRWVLPLDAAKPELHDRLRVRRGGHHGLVLERMERLRAARRSLTVSTVVTAWNAPALGELAAVLEQYSRRGGRLHAWHLYRFLPHGRGGARFARELDLSAAAYEEACRAVQAEELPFRVYRRKDMQRSRTVDFFWYEDGALRAGSEEWCGEPRRGLSRPA